MCELEFYSQSKVAIQKQHEELDSLKEKLTEAYKKWEELDTF